ncbi:hypothetical protein LLG96_13940 [bacterium]|nr:hypothetical protein [bacterium]
MDLLILTIVSAVIGCSGLHKGGQSLKSTGGTVTQETGAVQRAFINGVVLLGSKMPVPDSLECTVSYFDFFTSKGITIPVKDGFFTLKNLVDEKYELIAVTKIGNLKGSSYVTISNGRVKGCKDSLDVTKIIMGIQRLEENPIPLDSFNDDFPNNPFGGMMVDN